MNYFIFNGVSSKDKGIIITKMPPISKPERRVNKIIIPGKNGCLYEDEKVYETIVIQIECAIISEDYNIREIMKWLEGEGKLILSTSPYCYYNANIINKIDYTDIARQIHEFPLQIELQPIAHSVKQKEINLTEADDIYIMESTYNIKPYIKAVGNGDITININNKTLILKNVDEYIELDSNTEEAYKGNLNKNNCVYSEEFLELTPGKNFISWIGNVSNIQIKYEEAYL